ncbi:MFS general substrate transporter [Mycena albidolilacea]|uniref:MFS general substrate transporter n=1 Tax=Mycena albidolilacea TaxID=1033008 RepID=A0AAD7ALV3_9AGAR|nr:MFS general substrate transporter [Mycena albidolilacea]
MSETGLEKHGSNESGIAPSDIDLLTFHEARAGRLVIDPEEAKVELGEAVASRLKLSEDGTKVLWPQPTDSPLDPQNWSSRRKAFQLFIITLASIVPDFDSGIGITAVFSLAEQYRTSPNYVNNLTSNWSIFLIGWGGVFVVILIRRYGRLPILFWSQVLAMLFLLGATLAPNLNTFAAMRCLTGFFGTAPQITVFANSCSSSVVQIHFQGLYVVTDMYPFHLQARKLNIWTLGFIVSPFLSPFLFGFVVARTTWRWAYGAGTIYGGFVCLLIIFFAEETMYDRGVKPIPEPPTTGLRYRVETLLGITGIKMAKYRNSWPEAIMSPIRVVWRPHMMGILLFEGAMFGFGIGIEVTNAVFFGTPPPFGFGFSQYAIAGFYATPVVAVFVGEFIGRYTNDWIMNVSIRRNNGIFEAESRLWACYIAVPLYICGCVVLGAAFQNHLSVGALVMGWGIAECAIMINTVAVIAYCSDSFPKHQGEVSAYINLARVLGGKDFTHLIAFRLKLRGLEGFSVSYFQIPWALKHGALQVLGVEAAIVAGLFVLVVPFLQLKGRMLRVGL